MEIPLGGPDTYAGRTVKIVFAERMKLEPWTFHAEYRARREDEAKYAMPGLDGRNWVPTVDSEGVLQVVDGRTHEVVAAFAPGTWDMVLRISPGDNDMLDAELPKRS